jgi:mannitol/fructose-specific phosphotransferase system IIA component (Ntr-type)
MLISPESRPDEHLTLLRWVSTLARDPDFTSFIRQAKNPQDILDVLEERAG